MMRNTGAMFMAVALCSALNACQPSQQRETIVPNQKVAANIWPALNIEVKPDPSVEVRAGELLSQMTLEQKVAQTIQPEIRDITVEDMRRYGFGSYLNGGGAFPNNNKHASVQDWVDLAEAMYQASMDDSIDGIKIPTMWGTDAVHGHNNVMGATLFPHNIGLGATRNPELIEKIAEATAKEVMATGIDWIFAPTVAVARDDRWGRAYESYSENPDVVRASAYATVRGLQGGADEDFLSDNRVISTVKHFVGDGGTELGDDQGDNLSDEQALFDIHAQGYVSGLSAGAQSVMASFNSWRGEKVHGSEYLLTQVLKERMGFDGFVVGDWNGHGQLPGCSNGNCPDAMNAGLDMYMVPTKAWKPLLENTLAQVKDGTIPLARLDDAVTRILRVKIRAGLFERPSPANRKLAGDTNMIGAPEHRQVAAQAVRESLVLLKNNNRILPLSPVQRILVAGDGADDVGKQAGGWSVTWQGTGNQNSDFPGATSIFDGIRRQVEAAGGEVSLSVTGDYDQKPDVAVVVFGEEPYAEGNGDIDNLEFQRGNKTALSLLKRLQADGIPVVSVFLSGRPMWVNAELNASTGFVAAWLPGSEGHAVADVLLASPRGEVQHDFVGKLSFSWPKLPNQGVLNQGQDPYDPLFAYGYGLNYGEPAADLPVFDETYDRTGDEELTTLALYDRSAKAPWILAAQSAGGTVDMTSSTLDTQGLQVRTMDRRVQEDALQLSWDGSAEASLTLYALFPKDLLSYLEQGASLKFDYKVLSGRADFWLTTRCLDECEARMPAPISSDDTDWSTADVSLTCLQGAGMDFAKVLSPFALQADGAVTLALSDIRIEPGAGVKCPAL